MNNKDWCKHIWWDKSLNTFSSRQKLGVEIVFIHDSWKQCPICGTKRPKKAAGIIKI